MFLCEKHNFLHIAKKPLTIHPHLWFNVPNIKKTLTEIMPCLEVTESRRLVRADAEEPGGLLPESAL